MNNDNSQQGDKSQQQGDGGKSQPGAPNQAETKTQPQPQQEQDKAPAAPAKEDGESSDKKS